MALAISDVSADLHFRMGQSLLLLGRFADARAHFITARDLDALRFRADSRINEVIRTVARSAAGSPVLVDAERALAQSSESTLRLPGDEIFYEHVHFRFRGNYLLACTFLHAIHDLLPEPIRVGRLAAAPPSQRDCARILAWTDFDRARMASTILEITKRPPFTNQIDHSRRIAQRRERLRALKERALQRLDQAESVYQNALSARPQDLRVRSHYASLLQHRGEHARAAEELRHLLQQIPTHDEWQTQLGFALADSGRLDEAESELRAVLQRSPHAEAAHLNLGTVLASRGEHRLATDQYQKALHLNPRSEEARLNLASLLERQGQLQEAMALYHQTLALDPLSAAAHARIGGVLERQGRVPEAIREYRRALELDPDRVSARNNLGVVLERQGQRVAAIVEYRQAVKSEPGYARARFNLADALLASGRAEEAIETYGGALRLQPGNLQGRYNMAGALQMEARWVEAAGEFERVLAAEPERVGALHNLAWILASTEDPELRNSQRAVRLAEKARDLTSGAVPEILETLAVAYAAEGEMERALQTGKRALQLAVQQGQPELVHSLEDRLRVWRRPGAQR